jgi:riboflavin kinase / FMN adenylyltransferase
MSRSADFWIGKGADRAPERLRGGSVCIGNFDGMHRGHRAVLASASVPAHAAGRPALVLTFEPHPRAFFRPSEPLFRLTPPPLKAELIASAGLDGVLVLDFDAALSALSAEAFVREMLVERLAPHSVVVGYDFHFGRRREGTPARLKELGEAFGFETVFVDPVGNDDPVSASAVRAALAEGRVEDANGLLGYRWLVEGEVEHGAKRGRELGYPTANIALDPGCRLRFGIYAVRVQIADTGAVFGGVASFGRRPMFDNGAPLLEVFLFDFSGDLYGRTLRVEFLSFLRGEEKFDGLEALLEQMDRDSAAARRINAAAADPAAPSLLK